LTHLKSYLNKFYKLLFRGKLMTGQTITDPATVKQASLPYSGSTSYMFPAELASADTFFSMNIRSYEYSPGYVTGAAKSVSGYTLHLPVPMSGLDDTFNIKYEDHAFGLVGGIAATAGSIVNGTGNIGGAVLSGIEAFAKHAITVGSESLAAATGKIITGKAEGVAGIDSAVGIGLGYITNPNIGVAFAGVGIRTHSFAWKFIAKNAAEASTIAAVVKLLKASALPSKNSGQVLLLNYPDVAMLALHGPKGSGLITFSPLGTFIEQISVNYGGQSHPPAFFPDNSPVEVNLSMTFRERSIITSEDISG
jgi:hypothetical protein